MEQLGAREHRHWDTVEALVILSLEASMARRAWLPIVLVLLGTLAALGQDVPDALPEKAPPKEKIKVLKEIVKPTERLSRRIFLVIDVSGSMKLEGQVGKVLDAVRLILQQPLDDFELGMATFSDKATRWPGVKDADDNPKPVAWGWARLPSQTTVDAAEKWLAKIKPFGGTEPSCALEIALKERVGELCVILISDGGFSANPVMHTVDTWQAWRKKEKLGEAVIMSYGVGGDAETSTGCMPELGTKWKGGFYVDDLKVPHVAPVESKTPY